jgi:DNA topoisomerase-2
VLTLLYEGGYTPYSKFVTLEERKRQILLTEEHKAAENEEGENPNEEQKEEQKEEPLGSLPVKSDDYDYLCNMNMWSLTKEKIEELKNKMNKIESEIAILKDKSPQDIWKKDLDDFVLAYELNEKKEHDIENKEIAKVKPINYKFDVEKLKKAKIKFENEGKKEKEKGKKKGKGGKEGKDKKIKESKVKEGKKKRGRSKEEESPLDDATTKGDRSVSTTAKKSKAKKKAPKDQTSSISVDSSESWSMDSKKEEKKKRQKKNKNDNSADMDSSMKDDTDINKEEEKAKKTASKIEDDPKVKPKKSKTAIPNAEQKDINQFFGPRVDKQKKAEEPKAMKKPITFETNKLSGKKFTTISDD